MGHFGTTTFLIKLKGACRVQRQSDLSARIGQYVMANRSQLTTSWRAKGPTWIQHRHKRHCIYHMTSQQFLSLSLSLSISRCFVTLLHAAGFHAACTSNYLELAYVKPTQTTTHYRHIYNKCMQQGKHNLTTTRMNGLTSQAEESETPCKSSSL